MQLLPVRCGGGCLFWCSSCCIWGPTGLCAWPHSVSVVVDCCDSQMRLFADGVIVYCDIVTITDHSALQGDLNSLSDLAGTWQMDFNASKCNLTSITNKCNPSTTPVSTTSILNHYRLPRLMTTWESAMPMISDGVAIAGKSCTKLLAPLESIEEPCSKAVNRMCLLNFG